MINISKLYIILSIKMIRFINKAPCPSHWEWFWREDLFWGGILAAPFSLFFHETDCTGKDTSAASVATT